MRRSELLRFSNSLTRDSAIAEEAVHDALLYGLSGAPNIENELHAFRFLKWKTRMLVYDKARMIEKTGTLNSDELELLPGHDLDPADNLVRVEEEAIVRAALLRLSERQRSVLVAKYFMDQSGKETAAHLGIGTEAHKQLLLRSRKSFKRNLAAVLEERGLSVSDFLTNFSRSGTRLAALTLLLTVGLSSFVPFLQSEPTPHLQGLSTEMGRFETLLPELGGVGAEKMTEEGLDNFTPNGTPTEYRVTNNQVSTENLVVGTPAPDTESVSSLPDTANGTSIEGQNLDQDEVAILSSYLSSTVDEVEPAHFMVSNSNSLAMSSGAQVTLQGSGPNTIFLGLGTGSGQPIQYLSLVLEIDGLRIGLSPKTLFSSVVSTPGGGRLIEVGATDFIAGDLQGNFDFVTTSESFLARSYLFLTLEMSKDGDIREFSTNLLQR